MTPQSEMKPDKEKVLELLHKCLDPYLPPIISDGNQSLNIIAETIDNFYNTRSSGGQGLGALDEIEVRKVMEQAHHVHCKSCRGILNKIDRMNKGAVCCCGLFMDLAKAVAHKFGTLESRAVKWPEKKETPSLVYRKGSNEVVMGDSDQRRYGWNEAIDACISAYNAGSGAGG